MDDETHFYEPTSGHGLAHDPFSAIVGPRPIGWISTVDGEGRRNLAPYSFFNAFNYAPPIIGFCSIGHKDSVRNIEATGEFVWNLSTFRLADAMNATSRAVSSDVDEFVLSGLTAMSSKLVGVPRVAESPVSFECKLTQFFRLRTVTGRKVESWMVFGEVVGVHIGRDLIVDGVYQTTIAEPILRGGGSGDYFKITEAAKFIMRRPK